MEAVVRSSKLCVVHHRGRGGGGRDVGADGVSVGATEDGQPVLQPLGQGVVGALRVHRFRGAGTHAQ